MPVNEISKSKKKISLYYNDLIIFFQSFVINKFFNLIKILHLICQLDTVVTHNYIFIFIRHGSRIDAVKVVVREKFSEDNAKKPNTRTSKIDISTFSIKI